jgi:hypothetical protein
MRKAVVGVAAVGAFFVLRKVMGSVGHQMRQHCEQMMAQFAGREKAVSGT